MKRLDGKAALITGAATGIGEAIAHKFALEGADILLAGLPDDPLAEVAADLRQQYPEVQVATYAGDLADEEHAEACVRAAVDAFGKLDVLVNNAGVLPETAETQEYPVAAADAMLHANCRAAFLVTRAALPYLRQTRGNVVSAGSEAGFNGTPEFTAYGASKAWMHAFMKGLAVEQAKAGVRANCVCPGPIDTAWTHAETGPMDEEMEEMMVAATAMGRRGTPEEVANAYAFLASDEASYITGALLLVDGGITVAHGNVGEEVPAALRRPPAGVLSLRHSRGGND